MFRYRKNNDQKLRIFFNYYFVLQLCTTIFYSFALLQFCTTQHVKLQKLMRSNAQDNIKDTEEF